ncbi:leucyl aminopeptidase family protein [Sphingomonas sp. H39-1-10]|uniref:leucyl aminopeptidase family protein n=1 Tax=Sphingomonas pollutisoli TaxID=3030829 RepID=UPI0023B8D67D|nr:leucyl aminopeptidase family protein [Sphingomonas pollutisoli]MDF0487245.1 leucyl aminopeptidase family protein [Sphingomonas pollutisoli]
MTYDPTPLLQPDRGQAARTIHIVTKDAFETWRAAQPPRVRAALDAARVEAKLGASAILPGGEAEHWSVLLCVAKTPLGTWDLAKLAETLPDGSYRLDGAQAGAALLGWALAQHAFTRYKQPDRTPGRVLLTTEPARIPETLALARATAQVRDLVNTAAADLGPAELEAEAAALAEAHGAQLTVTKGAALASGYPMIHAVGQAAAHGREPRLIELEWGNPAHPRLAVIGKGVCFDSGGLDIKPSAGMRLMKKDMGGAAHALALAGLIMGAHLPVRLHLLIPAVENAIAGNAFRPGDVLATRKGLTVENTNTDAEGRLILGDALTRAGETSPELILDFATLTGAARVALGPDLPATFANDDALAEALLAAGTASEDPLWRMPLWDGYDDMLASDIANLLNAPDGGFAGAVTAALFLRRFVPEGAQWAHLDTFAWRPSARPGRPKGGEALGLRAVWAMLKDRYTAA